MTPHRFDELRSRVAELERQLRGILSARDEGAGNTRASREEAEELFQKACKEKARELEVRRHQLDEAFARSQKETEDEHARALARLERAHAGAAARVKEEHFIELGRLNQELDKSKQQASSGLQEKHARLSGKVTGLAAEVDALHEETEALQKKVAAFAASLKVPPGPPAEIAALPPADRGVERAREKLGETAKILGTRRRQLWIRFACRAPFFLSLLILILGHGAALWAVRRFRPADVSMASIFVTLSLVTCLFVAALLRGILRQNALAVIEGLRAGMAEVHSLLRHQEKWVKGGVERHRGKLLDEKIQVVAGLDEKFRASEEKARASQEERLGDLKRRLDDRVARVHRKSCVNVEEAEARLERERAALEELQRTDLDRRRGEHAAALGRIAAEGQREADRLAGEWKQSIHDFMSRIEEARRQSRERHVPWSDPGWKEPRMGETFPATVYLGDVVVDLKTLAEPPAGAAAFTFPGEGRARLPLSLSFPDQGCFFAAVGPEPRGRAFEALFSMLLRILTAFPPGKAKFLIFDPVGLGQNLSALMHLADYDESLVGGRIWTETVHIERKLTELTEHIEKVIQKYLRNRHASIDEYNREVGEMAEAYRFLVLPDFPAGFSDLALEKLTSIITSGPRCGVFTLILHDRKQKLPGAIDAARLKSNGHALQGDADGFVAADDVIRRGILEIEEPPAGDALTAILHAVGRRCVEAKRVEVPFESVAPKPGQEWSLTTEGGVRVSLGRAAAERLQYLDLGRGTAQHALIAGKTGSGKSTLFRVMITNLAAWYGPQEVEFYLIDYKKGVEFKTFAVHGLPHARVVAIESDREFGLSVLRRIDQEFVTRAELFRKAGVQDFAGYRRSGAEERLPRTLLLIDEFQEFFVEEDATSQEAALLLDRIVRQGRAFGVHVILGSQTLGGSYTLAKATLGQMAVRIALQCNEADSYLILSDDNAAARLLSRPGDAIYNDMAGMIEGNNPFQVVWLSDETEARHLRATRERAERAGWKPREPMTVFEGNVPADLRNNGELRRRLARAFAPDGQGPDRAWVGEANAIKGPTEVRFRRQGGSNLLVIGHQRESALAVVVSSVVSLAAAHAPGTIRFVVLDGSPPELAGGRGLSELAKLIPHEIELPEYARVPQVMEELDAEVKARLERGGKAERPVYLVVHDLPRFRKLRQADDIDFSGGEGGKPSPDKCLANILTDGPAQGVHTIVWCDSLNNLNRAFNRKTLREFDMRILFQMSVSDSSELIDQPMAGKLGLHRGLLAVEEEGTIEKFRPYALPDAERVEEIRRAFQEAAARLKAGPA